MRVPGQPAEAGYELLKFFGALTFLGEGFEEIDFNRGVHLLSDEKVDRYSNLILFQVRLSTEMFRQLL